MPILIPKLKEELTKIIDSEHNSFVGFPLNTDDMALKWSVAINEYAKSVFPISTTSEIAKQAFYAKMQLVTLTPPSFYIILKLAFADYALSLASGMTGAGFVGTPPPSPIIIEPAALVAMSMGNTAYIQSLCSIIDPWFKTGTAVPISGGPPINWN